MSGGSTSVCAVDVGGPALAECLNGVPAVVTLAHSEMPRSTSLRSTATDASASRVSEPLASDCITIRAAAHACGWKRANTFRERFLSTVEDAVAMGLRYDECGRAYVDAVAVEAAAQKMAAERANRSPTWRIENLGNYRGVRPPRSTAEDNK